MAKELSPEAYAKLVKSIAKNLPKVGHIIEANQKAGDQKGA